MNIKFLEKIEAINTGRVHAITEPLVDIKSESKEIDYRGGIATEYRMDIHLGNMCIARDEHQLKAHKYHIQRAIAQEVYGECTSELIDIVINLTRDVYIPVEHTNRINELIDKMQGR